MNDCDEADQRERDALQALISENVPDVMIHTPYDFELRDRRLQQMSEKGERMNKKWIEKTRAFLNQPDDVYEEAPAIALELLETVDELCARVAELETKLRTLEKFYSHTFAGTGVRRCGHCGSEGDSAEPPEHALTCPYYGLPVIDLEAE